MVQIQFFKIDSKLMCLFHTITYLISDNSPSSGCSSMGRSSSEIISTSFSSTIPVWFVWLRLVLQFVLFISGLVWIDLATRVLRVCRSFSFVCENRFRAIVCSSYSGDQASIPGHFAFDV